MIKKILFCATIVAASWSTQAQENKVFRDTRIINGHSVETEPEGQAKFIISHRFGTIENGVYDIFGLDNANIRFGLDYGVNDNLTVGVGRSSLEKTYDGYAKYKLLEKYKEGGKHVGTITFLSTVAVNTLTWTETEIPEKFEYRLFYTNQLLIAKRFSDRLSVQLMPTYVHRNLVGERAEANGVFAVGAGAKYQLTKTLGLQAEYYYVDLGQLGSDRTQSFSIGVDIESKGHNFQFSFTNALGMVEKFFIVETRNAWEKGEISFGFNIDRDFRFKGRKRK